MRWEKTFELVVPDPVVSVRKAFLETDDPQAWNRVFTGDPYFSGGAVRVATHETESDLAWEEIEGEDHIEMTVTFRETATGTTISLTRTGFGESDEWVALHTARFLGWVHALHDFAVYLRTGSAPQRLFNWRTYTGMTVVDAPGGLRVIAVDGGGWAARAGLTTGDIVIRIASAPVFDLSDLWVLHSILDPSADAEVEYVREDQRRVESAPLTAPRT